MPRTYEINEHPRHLGGGWVLTMFEDEEEMGRGYYPLFRQDRPLRDDEIDPITKALFAEAQEDGEDWLDGEVSQ